MPLKDSYRAFIFDLDDTIVSSERLNVELIQAMFSDNWGIELDEGDKEYIFGHSCEDIYGRLIKKYDLDTSIDIIVSEEMVAKRKWLSKNILEIAKGIEDVLKLSGEKVIVSGSSGPVIQMSLDNVGLADYFSTFFSSDDYENGKPAPDGFKMAIDYLKVPAEKILAFEDSTSGIRAAKAAGLDCVFIRQFALDDASELADASYENFAVFYQDYKNKGNGQ